MPPTRIELFNARIADVEHGAYFPHGTRLVIVGGRIEALPGPGETLPSTHRVDLGGRAVIPGLFNTHSHIHMVYPSMLLSPWDMLALVRFRRAQVEQTMSNCLARGVLHVRDALASDLRPNRDLRARIESGAIPGPRLYQCVHISQPGGPYTRGPGLLERLIAFGAGSKLLAYDDPDSGVIAFPLDAGDRQVRDAVDQAVNRHAAECIKLYDQLEFVPNYAPGARMMTDAQMAAAVDQAHRRGRKAALHHTTVESFRRGVRAGVDSFAHLPLDGPLSPADVEAFVRAGCVLEPTVTLAYYLSWAMRGAPWTGSTRLARLEELRSRTHAGLVEQFWLPGFHRAALGHFSGAARGRFNMMLLMDMSPAFRYWGRMIAQGVDNLRMVYDAGGMVACGSDAGAVPATQAMVNLELSMLAFCLNGDGRSSSFTPADALRAATIHSARALGLQERFGALSPGKTADLVVLDGDPLADLARIGAPAAAVFVEGRLRHNLIINGVIS